MSDQGTTTIKKMGRYTVELTVVKVPVPAVDLPTWKMAVADLYERLEEMVQEDRERAYEQKIGSQNVGQLAA